MRTVLKDTVSHQVLKKLLSCHSPAARMSYYELYKRPRQAETWCIHKPPFEAHYNQSADLGMQCLNYSVPSSEYQFKGKRERYLLMLKFH